VVRGLLEHGLNVWFNEWRIKPGDNSPVKIDEGLEHHSRVLVVCMSVHAFGSDRARWDADTFRFREPLNKARPFIPSGSTMRVPARSVIPVNRQSARDGWSKQSRGRPRPLWGEGRGEGAAGIRAECVVR
jgi:hypothetical protein